jgi:hypothetical protein
MTLPVKQGRCPVCRVVVDCAADRLCPRHHAGAVARLRGKEALAPGCRYQPPLTGAADEDADCSGYGPFARPSPGYRPDPTAKTDPGPSWDDAVRAYEENR